MHMQACHLRNYRSFRDSGDIRFALDSNLIVGPNNVGKTALLTALELQSFSSMPHRDADVPLGAVTDPNSWMSVEIVVAGSELESRLLSAGGQFQIPVPEAVVNEDGALQQIPGILYRDHPIFSPVWENNFCPPPRVHSPQIAPPAP